MWEMGKVIFLSPVFKTIFGSNRFRFLYKYVMCCMNMQHLFFVTI